MSPPPLPLVQAANLASEIVADLYGFRRGALNLFVVLKYSEIPTAGWKCDSQSGDRCSYNRRFISEVWVGRWAARIANADELTSSPDRSGRVVCNLLVWIPEYLNFATPMITRVINPPS